MKYRIETADLELLAEAAACYAEELDEKATNTVDYEADDRAAMSSKANRIYDKARWYLNECGRARATSR